MSGRGATHRGKHVQRFDQKMRSRKGQRNRRRDKWDGQLSSFPSARLRHMVDKCRSKVAHDSYGAAWAAKTASERDFGKEFFVYECPICGKWHLTTTQWMK